MGRRKDKIKLGAFLLFTGHHVAAWRHPQASVGTDFEDYFELAKLAEAAKFDAIFFADGVAARLKDVEAASRKAHSGVYPFEPITLLSALSSVTSNIGLIATASTSFSDPYNLARQFGSLDRLSGGRAGWNLVTSSDPEAAYNFGHEAQILHADRYDRAEEFADVVLGLWDSWDDDAFIRDRESGRYFDPVRLHRLNHKGRHFKVRGPLNIPRSPQGRPVLVQAGASGPGKELAARTAEAIFAAHITLDEAKTFYADVKGKLGTYGRSPTISRSCPASFPSSAAARRKLRRSSKHCRS
ncbi:NtaA/DmoA family FMN-dependent monooxygenase (plasmid) [Rhizobium sp. C104]|uniref:NtaA/DmoA family FMN-dependent monooxygenase n=1 Tax=Rhizobium sp. C104 TaxID=2917727 RepID=UPI001EF792E0|nr:NtaA/DmoA family FMN-dependent monooxygenase [Rhizobium sp. C104]ULJ82772.1 NtaA/DmoA family FMN-dependent monooxygenase [Rhizobium sp. C104]